MTGNPNIFSSFQSHKAPSLVIVVDGSTCNSVGFGTVKPTSSITLSSVLSLPKLAFNLISVSKLTRDLNSYISFFPGHCLIRDLKMN
uniref:Putative ovule protein n=1 Tax=Solanum chacoense TaxID=4108 RepID=A0A0V0HI32_SOLCH